MDIPKQSNKSDNMTKNGLMPLPGAAGFRKWDGSRSKDFFEDYEGIARMHNVLEENKIAALRFWVTDELREYLKTLSSYTAENPKWSDIKEELLEVMPSTEYQNLDKIREDLMALVRKPRDISNEEELSLYYLSYATMASILRKEDEITHRDAVGFFMVGLPESLRDDLDYALEEKEKSRETTGDATRYLPTLQEIMIECRRLVTAKHLSNEYMRKVHALKPVRGEQSVKWDEWRGRGSYENKEMRKTSQPIKEAVGDSIQDLSRQLADLKINMNAISSEMRQFRQPLTTAGYNPPPPHRSLSQPAIAQGRAWQPRPPLTGANSAPIGDQPPRDRLCNYDNCGPVTRMRDCVNLQKDVKNNYIQLDEMSHVHTVDGVKVPFRAGGMRSWVVDHYSRQGRNVDETSPVDKTVEVNARVQYGEIVGIDPEWQAPAVGNSRRSLVGKLETLIEPERSYQKSYPVQASSKQNTARAETAPYQKPPGRKNVIRIPNRVGQDTDSRADTETVVASEERYEVDEHEEEVVPRRVAKERPSRVTRLYAPVEENFDHNNLTKKLLDASVSVGLGELLALSKPLADATIGQIKRRRVPIPVTNKAYEVPGFDDETMTQSASYEYYNTASAEDRSQSESGPATGSLSYAQPLGTIEIKAGGQTVTALVDTGSQVNIMSESLYNRLSSRLALRELHPDQLKIRGMTGHSASVIGVCENVGLQAGAFETVGHFYVSKSAGGYEMIAGLPFLQKVTAQIHYAADGVPTLSMQSDDGVWYRVKLNDVQDMEEYKSRIKKQVRVNIAEMERLDNPTWDCGEDPFAEEEQILLDDSSLHFEVDEPEAPFLQDFEYETYMLSVDAGLRLKEDATEKKFELAFGRSDRSYPKQIRAGIRLEPATEEMKYQLLQGPSQYKIKQANQKEIYSFAAYKPKGVKVRPLAIPLPQEYSLPRYFRPQLSRDPYQTPLALPVPSIVWSERLTSDRVKTLDLGPEGFINDEERELLLYVLSLREKALAFTDSEKGCLNERYASDYEIPVVPHTPWKEKAIPIPKALYPQIVELLKREVDSGDLEPSFAPYATRWFTVAKKSGALRKVVDASPMNAVTIRDAGQPPKISEFVQDFVGYQCYALLDLFRGYEQRWLSEKSRDMTSISTPLGLLKSTKILQGATNSVAEFQRMIAWVLDAEIPKVAMPFIDDIGVKGPTDDYDNKILQEGSTVRKWVWEHAVNLERILYRLEDAGLTVSGEKLVVITPALSIVGSVVSKDGMKISRRSKNKVKDWQTVLHSVKEVRALLGTMNAIRAFIPSIGTLDAPLRELVRKRTEFKWERRHTEAVEALKAEVGNDRLLVRLDYKCGRPITLAVDSSVIAAGLAIYQESAEGERKPARFDSIAFSEVESRYSQPKLELCGVFKAVKRCRLELYGIHFILEVDARSIVQMINNPELPNSPMNRWLAHLKLYDFEIRHVSAKSHELVDGLSRGRFSGRWESSAEEVEDEQLMLAVASSKVVRDVGGQVDIDTPLEDSARRVWIDGSRVPYEWKDLVYYLQNGNIPEGITYEDNRTLLRRAGRYFLRDGRLWRRAEEEGGHPREVVLEAERQIQLVKDIHSYAHRGINATYVAFAHRYWCENLKKIVTEVVKSCEQCQRRSPMKERENLYPTATSRLFQKVEVDGVHMGAGSGEYRYFVIARDDFSGWAEAKAMVKLDADSVWEWFWEDIICRWGPVLEYVVTDNGSEFEGEFDAQMRALPWPVKKSVPYNPQGHGMIERGHKPIFDALQKLSKWDRSSWQKFLPAVLYADRATTKRTTGYSPYELVLGCAPVLPFDAEFETWVYTNWRLPMTTSEILVQRTRQILRSDRDLEIAGKRLEAARRASVEYMDKRLAHRTRSEPLKPGDYVLQYDSSLREAWSDKMRDRWYGPFVVVEQHKKGSYFLQELDGTSRHDSPVAAHRLRKFFLPPQPPLEMPRSVREGYRRTQGNGRTG